MSISVRCEDIKSIYNLKTESSYSFVEFVKVLNSKRVHWPRPQPCTTNKSEQKSDISEGAPILEDFTFNFTL